MFQLFSKSLSLVFICLCFVGCQVSVSDNEEAKASLEKNVQNLRVQNLVINESLILNNDLKIEADTVELGPLANIVTHGFKLEIYCRSFKSQGGRVSTFLAEELSYKNSDRGFSLKEIQIHSDSAEGILKIFNKGLNGKDGISHNSIVWPDLGEAATGPAADVSYVDIAVTRRGGDVEVRQRAICKTSNKGQDATIDGANAVNGEDGEDGGGTAQVSIQIESPSSLLVKYFSEVGKPGKGGEPSLPQKGQRGGRAGPSPENVCRGDRGADAQNGRNGEFGKSGNFGLSMEPQFKNVQVLYGW